MSRLPTHSMATLQARYDNEGDGYDDREDVTVDCAYCSPGDTECPKCNLTGSYKVSRAEAEQRLLDDAAWAAADEE